MSLLSQIKNQKVLVGDFTEFQAFVLTLYVLYFSRYLGTYIQAYRNTDIQKVSFYNIDMRQ